MPFVSENKYYLIEGWELKKLRVNRSFKVTQLIWYPFKMWSANTSGPMCMHANTHTSMHIHVCTHKQKQCKGKHCANSLGIIFYKLSVLFYSWNNVFPSHTISLPLSETESNSYLLGKKKKGKKPASLVAYHNQAPLRMHHHWCWQRLVISIQPLKKAVMLILLS